MAKCIEIFYGPYEAFFTLAHRPQKLAGVREQLMKMGFCVALVPVDYTNCCVFEMMGYEVFRCDVRSLPFNTPHHLDTMCQHAVCTVVRNSKRISRASDYIWIKDLIYGVAELEKYHKRDKLSKIHEVLCKECEMRPS